MCFFSVTRCAVTIPRLTGIPVFVPKFVGPVYHSPSMFRVNDWDLKFVFTDTKQQQKPSLKMIGVKPLVSFLANQNTQEVKMNAIFFNQDKTKQICRKCALCVHVNLLCVLICFLER